MLPLHCVLLAAFLAPFALATDDPEEALFAAVRKSDAGTVKELLSKGADVNAKTGYGQTPLFFACDRGNIAIVRILLDHGVDVNAKDTFYNTTAVTWAAAKDHVGIVELLLEKGATDVSGVLAGAIGKGNVKMAKAALATGKLTAPMLTSALAQAERANKPELIELLKAAGAKPREEAKAQVPPEVLATYEGKYSGGRGGTEMEVVVKAEDGKLVVSGYGNPLTLAAINNTRFRVAGNDEIELDFVSREGKVTGIQVYHSGGTMDFKRLEPK